MDYKKILGEIGVYFGAGISLRDYPIWFFITVITVTFIKEIFKYLMRNHRQLSDKYIDDNGEPRETTYK